MIDPNSLIFRASSRPSPEKIISMISEYGVVLLRGAASPRKIRKTYKRVKHFYLNLDQQVSDGTGDFDAQRRDYALVGGLAGVFLEDDVRWLLDVIGSSLVNDYARHYLDSQDLVVAANHFLFRLRNDRVANLIQEDGNKYAFHQDHDLVDKAFPFNVWIPMTKINSQCTGLSFVFPYTTDIFPLPFDVDHYIKQNNGFIWSPELEVGDVLLFHHSTIHGSYTTLGKPLSRYSAEFRIGVRSNAPSSYEQWLRAFGPTYPTAQQTLRHFLRKILQ